MAVGREATQTASDINGQVGGICAEVDYLMTRIGRMQAFMIRQDLTLAPYSMTAGDSGTIKGAMTLLEAVHQQYLAQANLSFVYQCMGMPNN